MKKIIHFTYIISVLVVGLAFPTLAFATEKSDITSGLNTLPLLVNKISGDATMAIVYNPENVASKADAERIKKIVDSGVELPDGGQLSAILVGTQELGKLSRAQIAFLVPGLTTHFDEINRATSAASILTITTDIGCVAAAKCIIGVKTAPKLTVYYSKQAADNAKIEFSQAFSMVVKQP